MNYIIVKNEKDKFRLEEKEKETIDEIINVLIL